MASNDDACIRQVRSASEVENEAIELDRAGRVQEAIAKYEQCERQLATAIDLALPDHVADKPKLIQHRQEILDRLGHLRSLRGNNAPTIPVEQQIKAVQLGMQATGAATGAVNAAGGAKTMAACAALGAAGGFVVLGGVLGGGIAAVGGAAGAAYVATRQDKAGQAARSAGHVAVRGVEKAAELNREHQITTKIATVGNQAVTQAKAADQKYGVTDKVGKGVGAVMGKAQEIEQKHDVTGKVAKGFSAGLSKISSALEGRPRNSTAGSSDGAAASAAAAAPANTS